jgi:CBS-domain-containing membrane protein
MRAKDVMSDGVMSINVGATVLEAARLLVNGRVSAMPVIDEQGFMVGILSEADLIRHSGGMAPTELSDKEQAAQALAETKSRRVADVMTKDVVTASEDSTLREIADLFLKHGIKRVPILRDRSVVGIVSRVDLLQALISLGPEAYAHKPAGARTADDELRAAVMSALQRQSWSQARQSDVVISHGVVHLWGMVANDSLRSAYVEAVRTVPGVSSVENHMHVGRPRTRPGRS